MVGTGGPCHTPYAPTPSDWIGWKPRTVEETVDAGVHPAVAKMRMAQCGLAKNPDGIDLRASPWDKGKQYDHGVQVKAGGYTFNRRNGAASLSMDTHPHKQLERLSAMGINPADYLKMAKKLGVDVGEGVLGAKQDVQLPTGQTEKKKGAKKAERRKKGSKKAKKGARKKKGKGKKKRKAKTDSSSSSSSSGSSSSSSEEEEEEEKRRKGSEKRKQPAQDAPGGTPPPAEEEEQQQKLQRQAQEGTGNSSPKQEEAASSSARPRPAGDAEAGILRMEGSTGCMWLTRSERKIRGLHDGNEPEDIFTVDPKQPATLVAAVAAERWAGTGQAGLYAIADAAFWVKLVVEGSSKGGCKILFAEQHMGVPFVRGKFALGKTPTEPIGLALTFRGAEAVAEWRDEAGAWHPLLRGSGWKDRSELGREEVEQAPGRLSPLAAGALDEGDERAQQRAACRLPLGWHAALITEQWPKEEGGARPPQVTFSEIAAVPAEPPEFEV